MLEWAAYGGGEVPILEVFKRCGDVVLRGMVSSGFGSVRLMVGVSGNWDLALGDLTGDILLNCDTWVC